MKKLLCIALLFAACRPSDTSQIFGADKSVSLVTGVTDNDKLHTIWVQKGEGNIIPFMIHAAHFQVGAENLMQIADVVYSYEDGEEIHTCWHKLVPLNSQVSAANCHMQDKADTRTDYVKQFAQLCAATDGYKLEVTLVGNEEDDFACRKKRDIRIAAECFTVKLNEDEKCGEVSNNKDFKPLYDKAKAHYDREAEEIFKPITGDTKLSEIVVNYKKEENRATVEVLSDPQCALYTATKLGKFIDCVEDGQINLLVLYNESLTNEELETLADTSTLSNFDDSSAVFRITFATGSLAGGDDGVSCDGGAGGKCVAEYTIQSSKLDKDVICVGVVSGRTVSMKVSEVDKTSAFNFSCLGGSVGMEKAYKVFFSSLKSQE